MFLTERQREIIDFIDAYRQDHGGVAPTQREICERFGFRSFGTIQKHLRLLEEKGALKRTWNQRRGLEPGPVRLPRARRVTREVAANAVELPLYGTIAAGSPIDVVAGNETMHIPESMVRGGECFLLKVRGDSMVEDGILDGDTIVVARRQQARNGEVVVAEIEGEVTLKRFHQEGSRVRLEPANAAMRPIVVDAMRLRVQGVLVGLLRRY